MTRGLYGVKKLFEKNKNGRVYANKKGIFFIFAD